MEKGKKRKEIRDFIIEYIKEHGYSPSVREIGDGVGLKSTSTVHKHLIIMLQEGMIETDAGLGIARAIRIPEYKFVRIDDIVEQLEKQYENDSENKWSATVIKVWNKAIRLCVQIVKGEEEKRKMILCKSEKEQVESTKCIACMDGFESKGGNSVCNIAEDCDFEEEKILKECPHAERER